MIIFKDNCICWGKPHYLSPKTQTKFIIRNIITSFASSYTCTHTSFEYIAEKNFAFSSTLSSFNFFHMFFLDVSFYFLTNLLAAVFSFFLSFFQLTFLTNYFAFSSLNNKKNIIQVSLYFDTSNWSLWISKKKKISDIYREVDA